MKEKEWEKKQNAIDQRDAKDWIRRHGGSTVLVQCRELVSAQRPEFYERIEHPRYKRPAPRLHSFWGSFRNAKSAQDRLNLLREMADWVSYPICKKRWRQRRRGFDSHKEITLPLNKEKCQVCFSWATVRHHIIQVQNGGRNKRQNLIPLCRACHAEVHPWLKAKP